MSESQVMPSRARLFGTDGIRGLPGEPPLDRVTVTRLGFRLAETVRDHSPIPRVVVGGDTRESTPQLCEWIVEGLEAGGAEPAPVGVVPTPGVAYLTWRLEAAAGVAVSASHNPATDNGIKLLDAAGGKWSEAAELELERRMADPLPRAVPPRWTALRPDPERADLYLDHLSALLPPERPLAGLRIALDTAHGAASHLAGGLFARLGAEPMVLNAAPDGSNINADCGSTHPEGLARATVENRCHLGIAFDGDADRAILADEKGTVHDGDAMLYLWATAMVRRGELVPARIVATSMSNLGLERALAREGVEVVRCEVGDRAVVDTLRRESLVLGGEQSGHLVHLGLSATGDGLATAVLLAWELRRAGRPLSELLAPLHRLPQLLRNVPVVTKPDLSGLPRVQAALRTAHRLLGPAGRIMVRYSGTEPLARIMIEGTDGAVLEALAAELAEVLIAETGPPREKRRR